MQERTLPLVLSLNTKEVTLEQVGGKGASLSRMVSAGLPVPPGYYITTAAYRRFVAANDLQAALLGAVAGARAGDMAALEAASASIGGLFAAGQIPDDVAKEICLAYTGLGTGDTAVAVRSSATAEDLPEMSFAGQQETYLNIRGEEMLLDAVKRCWASLWTARAIVYRARQGISPTDVSLAVVVQELVPADAAGILFTANPLTGARDELMINAAWGLGEAIVGGLVTPDTVVVNKGTGAVIREDIADKAVMTVRMATGTREEQVPESRRRETVLTREVVKGLAGAGLQIEQLYGAPVDIEWAIRDGKIFIVQARPITALPPAISSSGQSSIQEWELPRPHGRYVRASVIELLPDPLSPLFATLGLPAWNMAIGELSRELGMSSLMSSFCLITINGYAYYDFALTPAQNVAFILMIPRLVSLISRLLRSSQKRWEEQARPAYAAVVTRWEATDLRSITAGGLLTGIRELLQAAARHYLTLQSGILPGAYMSESLFTVVYNRLIRRPGDPSALTFLLGYESVPIKAEESLYDLAEWTQRQDGLARRLESMSSAEIVAALRREETPLEGANEAWSEFRRRFAGHLARFGHMIYDLDFAKAVAAEDPAPLLETLKFFLSGQAEDPHKRVATATVAREEALQMILARLHGPRLALFRRLVRLAQRFAPLREDALSDISLGWPVLRRMLREIGRRLVAAGALTSVDDVFWLTLDEVRDALPALDMSRSVANSQRLVAERRATWESRSSVTPPIALPPKEGARFLGIDFSSWMPAKTGQAPGDIIKGIGASPGRVTATAQVIHGPGEFTQMRRGDILVAKITTPAWTPLFTLAAGVVTDIGGPLSHGSIVAREYHIPAVLGTGVATERIKSDQLVTVNGDAGTVTIAH